MTRLALEIRPSNEFWTANVCQRERQPLQRDGHGHGGDGDTVHGPDKCRVVGGGLQSLRLHRVPAPEAKGEMNAPRLTSHISSQGSTMPDVHGFPETRHVLERYANVSTVSAIASGRATAASDAR